MNQSVRRTRLIAAGVAVASMLGSGANGEVPEYCHLSFEALPDGAMLPEGSVLTDEYQDAFGVTFSNGAGGGPMVVVKGAPQSAFGSGQGADSPLVDGVRAIAGSPTYFDFDPPILAARLYVVDIENAESVTMTALGQGRVVQTITKAGGSAGTGDGVITPFTFTPGMLFDRIEFTIANGPVGFPGYAIDGISFIHPFVCGTGTFVEVAQESAPNAGDFDDHILGMVRAWDASANTAAEFYFYFTSYTGFAVPTVNERSHLFFAHAKEGLSLVMTHDRQNSGTGGNAETRLEIFGDPDGAMRTMQDELQSLTTDPDVYTGNPGDSVFTEKHGWATFDGDGQMISGLDGDWSATVAFTDVDSNPATPTINGLNSWGAYSSDGVVLFPALNVDRRLRLRPIPPPEPLFADLNCDYIVNGADLGRLLAAWGSADPAADLTNDGTVDGADLGLLLGAWTP